MENENGCRLGLEPVEIEQVFGDCLTSCANCKNLIYLDGIASCKLLNQEN